MLYSFLEGCKSKKAKPFVTVWLTFTPMADLPGLAILDYQKGDRKHTLWIHNRYGAKEQMPVRIYFRGKKDMPQLERTALEACHGHVLDVGAAAGSHALYLQEKGITVTAMDISPAACETMRLRGVHNVLQQDAFQPAAQPYDTILMLMNGIGFTATIAGLQDYLQKARHLVAPGGQLLFDSSDVMYLYEDIAMPTDRYYGEIDFMYEYRQQRTGWFKWLYVDMQTLGGIALRYGWKTEILFQDGNDQYLARLTME
jgi:SAM-dependent methyltransferase